MLWRRTVSVGDHRFAGSHLRRGNPDTGKLRYLSLPFDLRTDHASTAITRYIKNEDAFLKSILVFLLFKCDFYVAHAAVYLNLAILTIFQLEIGAHHLSVHFVAVNYQISHIAAGFQFVVVP